MAKKGTKKKSKQKKVNENNPYNLKKDIRMDSLKPSHQPKVRQELLDADYLKILDNNDLRYYAQFTDEWAGANVKKDIRGHVKRGQLHKTKELAKDCYDRNNKRNNDVFSVTKANYILQDIDEALQNKDGWYINNSELTEDSVIHNIDRTDHDEGILSFEEFNKLKENLTKEVRLMYEKYYSKKLK